MFQAEFLLNPGQMYQPKNPLNFFNGQSPASFSVFSNNERMVGVKITHLVCGAGIRTFDIISQVSLHHH